MSSMNTQPPLRPGLRCTTNYPARECDVSAEGIVIGVGRPMVLVRLDQSIEFIGRDVVRHERDVTVKPLARRG